LGKRLKFSGGKISAPSLKDPKELNLSREVAVSGAGIKNGFNDQSSGKGRSLKAGKGRFVNRRTAESDRVNALKILVKFFDSSIT
jgi:hypothetical protein